MDFLAISRSKGETQTSEVSVNVGGRAPVSLPQYGSFQEWDSFRTSLRTKLNPPLLSWAVAKRPFNQSPVSASSDQLAPLGSFRCEQRYKFGQKGAEEVLQALLSIAGSGGGTPCSSKTPSSKAGLQLCARL